jgi:mandelate racemase
VTVAEPKVAGLHAMPVELTLRQPLETASGSYGQWPMVLLDLKTDSGMVGHSFYHCFQPMMMRPVATLIAGMAGMIAGDALRPVEIDRKLRGAVRLIGSHGPVATAIALIEIAAWDALAKSLELPLWRLLGGSARATSVYKTLISMDPDRAAALAAEAKDQGFGGVKCKFGHPDRANDLALAKRVRAAVGDGFPVMGDFNQAHDVPEAMARMRMLDDHGLVWFEEPTQASDFAGHARLALASSTPVSFGENWRSPAEAAEAMRLAASDYAMPDLVNIGGVSAWLKTATVAHIHGLPMSSHAFPEVCAHLMGAIATPHWLEHVDIFDDIFAEPVKPVGGSFAPGTAPGLGIAWDSNVVARALVA